MEIASGHSDHYGKIIKKEMEVDKSDKINHPKHYVQGDIEPIDFINANRLDYLEGNIIKYVSRYKFKNGLEDLLKAQFYINMLVEREQED
jgi:hypothetical protein